MNQETKNLVAAICLSMIVLIGYQMLFGEKQNKRTDPITKDNNITQINKLVNII